MSGEPPGDGVVRRTGARLAACVLFLALLPVVLPAADDDEDEPVPVPSASIAARPPASGADALTLAAAITGSLKSNRTLSVRRIDPQIAAEQVQVEKGAFDHHLTLDVEAERQRIPTGSLLDGAAVSDVQTQFANLGVDHRFENGAVLTTQFQNQRVLTNSSFQFVNPQFTSALVVSLVQPLARDAGRRTNLANLRIAENAAAQGGLRLRKVVLDTVAAVERAYWDLYFARQDRDVKTFASHAADELVAFDRHRLEQGIGPESDVVEASAAASARMEELSLAERQLGDAEEILRRLVGLGRPTLEKELYPADALPATPPPPVLASSLSTAFSRRPDYQDLLLDLKSRDIRVAFLENQTRPRVDLVATYQQNGLAGGYGTALDQVLDADFHGYIVGVQVALPLENRAAEAQYRAGQLAKQQAVLAVSALADQIDEEVTRAVRAMRTDQRRLELARNAERLAQRQYAIGTQRFQEGLVLNRELLRFQEDLAAARTRLLRANVDLVKDGVDLAAVTGALLDQRGIALRDNP